MFEFTKNPLCLGLFTECLSLLKILYVFNSVGRFQSPRNKIFSDPSLLPIRMQINNTHINRVAISGFRLVMCTGILTVVNVVEVTF